MYSEKDLKELDAENIEFPDGSMHTLYEAEQQQRAYERKIRRIKRTLKACDEAINNLSDEELLKNLKHEFEKYSVKLKSQEAELNNFCKKTGLQKDNPRIQAYGFGKSTAQKATGSAKSYYKSWSKEYNINNIKTLADYYNVKYNDIKRYELLRGYIKAVDKGDISPLIGFDFYEQKAQEITKRLYGLVIKNEYEIKGFVPHFIDRVIG